MVDYTTYSHEEMGHAIKFAKQGTNHEQLSATKTNKKKFT